MLLGILGLVDTVISAFSNLDRVFYAASSVCCTLHMTDFRDFGVE